MGAGSPRPCIGIARRAEGGYTVKQCYRSLGLGSVATCGQGVEPEGHLPRAQYDPWRQAQRHAGCHSLGFSLLCHYPSDLWKNAADDSTSWRISKQCPNSSACKQSRFYEPEPQPQLAFLVSYLLPSTPGPSPRPSRLLVIPKHDAHSLTLSPTLFLTDSHPLGLPTCPLPLLYLVSGFSTRLGAE